MTALKPRNATHAHHSCGGRAVGKNRRTAFAAGAMSWAFVMLLIGCSASLLPAPPAPAVLLTLDDPDFAPTFPTATTRPAAMTLLVELPHALAGADSRNMAYMRRAQEVSYFAQHQWVEKPATMLAPLMARGLRGTNVYGAVVLAPARVKAERRLESTLVRLQQDFTRTPSEVRLTLHAWVTDTDTRRLMAQREFDIRIAARSDDAPGGAAAAQTAARQLVTELSAFLAEAGSR